MRPRIYRDAPRLGAWEQSCIRLLKMSAKLRVLPREISFTSPDSEALGIKASRLVEMSVLKTRVPRFGVLTREAFELHIAQADVARVLEATRDSELGDQVSRVARGEALRRAIVSAKLPELVEHALDEIRAGFGDDERFSVRPSPVAGDAVARALREASASRLFVHPDELADAVRAVFAQALSPEALEVRYQIGEPLLDGAIAVIIQRMVTSEVSGEARSLDPDRVEPRVRVDVSFGLGGGREEPESLRDRFLVERPVVAEGANTDKSDVESRLVEKRQALRPDEAKGRGTRWVAVDERQVRAPALSKVQARHVAEEALKLEASFGRPVSLGFSYSGRLLHILDAHLEREAPRTRRGGMRRVFDARPLPSALRGPTSPLTFSLAQRIVELAAVDALLKLDVKRDDLRANRAAFERLIGYVGGQAMANVEAWRTVLAILPRAARISSALGALLDVPGLLPDTEHDEPQGLGWVREIKAFRDLFASVRAEADALLDETNDLPAPADDDDEDALLGHLDTLEQHAVRAASLMSLCALSAAVLTQLPLEAVARAHDDAHTLQATREARVGAPLLDREAALVERWLGAAQAAQDHAVVREILLRDETEGALDRLEGRAEAAGFDRALKALGDIIRDRPASGWHLESPTFREDPRPVVARLRALLGADLPRDGARRRAASEAHQRSLLAVEAALEKRRVFGVMSEHKRARGALDDAAAARAYKRALETRVDDLAGAARAVCRALGARLCGYDLLDREQDVFYLQVDELRGLIRATSVIEYARPIVAARKRSKQARPLHIPARVETVGAVFDVDLQDDTGAPEAGGVILEGHGLVPGEERGTVIRIEDARAGDPLPAHAVIVAQAPQTLDLPLLVAAQAVVVEDGTELSRTITHLAEEGVPVVRLPGATSRLVAGEEIIVNADRGRVLRVARLTEGDGERSRTAPEDFARQAAPSADDLSAGGEELA
jgi:pyruvate,water dikinase